METQHQPLHYAPCQNCGMFVACTYDPREYHRDGLYCSKKCREEFKTAIQRFAVELFAEN